MRSSSGPERRRWWRARSAAVQRHASSPMPHGHGFEAATSMKRVGNATTCWPRTIVTCPSSSGWRSASRLERTNSDSSSRNSTPWWASVASPGSGCDPPPTRPEAEIVWCGARNGRRADEATAAAVQAGDGLDPGDVDRLGRRHRRQDRRQAAREHRLPGPGRAVHVDVVAAGRRHLERRDQRVLAADVGEVEQRLELGLGRRARAAAAGRRGPPARRRPPGATRSRARSGPRPAPPPAPARAAAAAATAGAGACPRRSRARRGSTARRRSATARRRSRSPRPRPAAAGRTRRGSRRPAAGRTPGRSCAGRRARG